MNHVLGTMPKNNGLLNFFGTVHVIDFDFADDALLREDDRITTRATERGGGTCGFTSFLDQGKG